MKTGRPTKITPEMELQICERIATSSIGLKHICEDLGIDPTTVYRRVETNEDFRNMYARAREAQADYMAEEIIEIADDGSNDLMTIVKGNQAYEMENKEVTSRSKLRVEARKWIASKLKPKKYGDKLDMTTDGEKITNVKVEVINSGIKLAGSEGEVNLD